MSSTIKIDVCRGNGRERVYFSLSYHGMVHGVMDAGDFTTGFRMTNRYRT